MASSHMHRTSTRYCVGSPTAFGPALHALCRGMATIHTHNREPGKGWLNSASQLSTSAVESTSAMEAPVQAFVEGLMGAPVEAVVSVDYKDATSE
jgi:hypothetical protein